MDVADVDGDGAPDIVFGGGVQNRLYLNRGASGFEDASAGLPGAAGTTSLAFLDVEGDGDLDLFVGNEGPNALLANDGSGVFSDVSSQLPLLSFFTSACAAGDVDGDGDLDLVVGNGGPPPFEPNRLYLNDGVGSFGDAPAQLPLDADSAAEAILVDVDADGDLDAVLANSFGPNRLYVNNGAGSFSEDSTALPANSDPSGAVAAGDVDGDGDPDLVIGNRNAQDRLYLNDGTGTFADATSGLPADTHWTEDLSFGDVDGDGDLDLLVGVFSVATPLILRDRNDLYLNDGTGTFTDAPLQFPDDAAGTEAVVLVDVDGDADLDAVVANSFDPPRDRLYLNDGFGTFVDVTDTVPIDVGFSVDVGIGDLDGDGHVDVVIGNIRQSVSTPVQRARNRIYRNLRTGVFVDESETRLPGNTEQNSSIALVDVEGDGDLDIVSGGDRIPFVGGGAQDQLLVNDGAGFFADESFRLPADGQVTTAVATGDVDGDGDQDLYLGTTPDTVTGATQGQDRLYRNDGSGFFADSPASVPSVSERTTDVALFDAEGDGDLDVVVANEGGASNRIACNDGSGTFSATGLLPVDDDPTQGVAVADVDGDGDPDLVFANLGQQSTLFMNDGSGIFTDATPNLPVEAELHSDVASADVDEDGDLDLIFAGRNDASQSPNVLYLNDGAGMFTEAVGSIPENGFEDSRALALADVDLDGDVDAWFANRYENRLWTNVRRQLSWRATPRVGKPLELELAGPPAGPWFLARALGRAAIPLPGVGILFLDLASLSIVGSGTLSAGGAAVAVFAIPPDPALAGHTVQWQAAVGAPLRLTNLERTLLTSL